MRHLKIFFTFFSAGMAVYISNMFSNYYYYNLSGREDCNTGIAPCFIGFSEMLGIQFIGWIFSFAIIFLVLSKLKVVRKWFVLILGIITLYAVNIILSLYNIKFP